MKVFPRQISMNVKRDCIHAFQEVTSEHHLPILTCTVCAQLTSENESTLLSNEDKLLERVRDETGKLVIDDCGRVGYSYHVCSICYRSLGSKSLSKRAILNGFNIECNHQIPHYLKNLTEVEEMMIAKSWPFGKVRKLGNDSSNYQQISRHIIIIPEKVFTVYSVLSS